MTSCLLSLAVKLFQIGSTLKEKNLLLEEQILLSENGPLLGREAKDNDNVVSFETVPVDLKTLCLR